MVLSRLAIQSRDAVGPRNASNTPAIAPIAIQCHVLRSRIQAIFAPHSQVNVRGYAHMAEWTLPEDSG